MIQAVKESLAMLCRSTDHFTASFMPSNNPFKSAPSPVLNTHRTAMLALVPQAVIESTELNADNTAPTYTIDTLKTLKARHPDDTLIFILGNDSLAALPTWRSGMQILNYVHLWAFDRGKLALPDCLTPHLTADLYRLSTCQAGLIYKDQTPIPDLSSSDIRTKVAHGEQIEHLTLPSIARYIQTHRLYE